MNLKRRKKQEAKKNRTEVKGALPGLFRGLQLLISDFFSWSLVYMALIPTLCHLPASLGAHVNAAVTVSLLGNVRQRGQDQ